MTTTTTSTGTFTRTPTTTTGPAPVTAVIDRFLAVVESGRGAELADVYADDADLDATVAELAVLDNGRDGDRRRVRPVVRAPGPLRGARPA